MEGAEGANAPCLGLTPCERKETGELSVFCVCFFFECVNSSRILRMMVVVVA